MLISYFSAFDPIPLECKLHKDRDIDFFVFTIVLLIPGILRLAHDDVKPVFVAWMNAPTHRGKKVHILVILGRLFSFRVRRQDCLKCNQQKLCNLSTFIF